LVVILSITVFESFGINYEWRNNKMGITKAIICIGCGKRFLVDRDEYEKRCEESLCDKCRDAIDEIERRDDSDMFSKVGETVTRVATSIGGKIESMLQDRTNKQTKQNNSSNEDDYNE
jgi:hypothetical protein